MQIIGTQRKRLGAIFSLALLLTAPRSTAQQHTENIPFGNFEQWLVREVKESAIIGGDVKKLYAIAPCDTIRGQIPYRNRTQWGTSNVMAQISGVTKCSISVFPEPRDHGFAARMDTRMESCKVLGLINITVLASGSIFLGEMIEPIKSTKNPNSKFNMGVPFTKRPTALIFDYKMKALPATSRTRATGFSARTTVQGRDYADVILLLQKRWEDAQGNIFAKRVGTLNQRFGINTPEWINNYSMSILYGNISKDIAFKPQMNLIPESKSHYARNSKGEIVPIQEIGWADENDTPTHLILQISSSYDGAYVGTLGNSFYVDNIKLAYE